MCSVPATVTDGTPTPTFGASVIYGGSYSVACTAGYDLTGDVATASCLETTAFDAVPACQSKYLLIILGS